MDIRPASSPIPNTSGIDALLRVRSSAEAGDSEDSQTGGYLFGDGRHPASAEGQQADDEPEGDSGAAPVDVVDLSADAVERHAIVCEPDNPDGPTMESVRESSSQLASERHIDIEA